MELYLEKRGMNFRVDEPMREFSDVGNYRVFADFISADGCQHVYVDFLGWNGRLSADAGFTDSQGNSWRYEMDCKGRRFTIAEILATVNEYALEHYDSVKWVDRVFYTRKCGYGDIHAEIAHWFRGCEKAETPDGTAYRCYTGCFRFWKLTSEPHGESRQYCAIMEEIPDRGYGWQKC